MTPKEVLKQARKDGRAIGSFNFSTAEVLRAIVEAGKKLESPLIVSTSEGEADFVGLAQAAALVDSWQGETGLPIILNLDHGQSLEKIKEAISAGYRAVHFDGSHFAYEENLQKTKEAVEYVKSLNEEIIVEGELGYLRGSSSLHEEELLEIEEKDLTDPSQAKEFVEKTGIDSLAMVIGNAHGVFVKSVEKLHLLRLEEIARAVGEETFLVLHGGSGIPADDVKKAIKAGIVKVNVNTEMRLAWRQGVEKSLTDDPKQAAPYKLLKTSFEEVKKVVEEKIKLFNGE